MAECKQYQEALHELLRQMAQDAHNDNGAAAAQALAISYQRILKRNGVSSAQMSKIWDSLLDYHSSSLTHPPPLGCGRQGCLADT